MTNRNTLLQIICLLVAIEKPGNTIPVGDDHVCLLEQENEQISLQKHEQVVVLHTTQACLDITQGFRCKVKSNGTKITYKGVPTTTKNILKTCCHGYYETSDGLCKICPEGTYGTNCTSQCSCTGTQICDNVIGCCHPEKDECRIPKASALKSKTGHEWMFPVLLASLVVVAVLSFGLAFYRKQYIKEKDPPLPTLTYHPYVKEYQATNELESREFDNPLYRQSAIEAVNAKVTDDELLTRGRDQRTGRTMNEYATLDDMGYAVSGPSSMENLLKPSPYEVPLPPKTTPEDENRSNERKC